VTTKGKTYAPLLLRAHQLLARHDCSLALA
jgi:hypothetical protein